MVKQSRPCSTPSITVLPLATAAAGSTTILSGLTEIAPGAALPEHYHNCEEVTVVLAGEAIAHFGCVRRRLRRHDVIVFPAGVAHRIENSSARRALRIHWSYPTLEATRTSSIDGCKVAIATLSAGAAM